MKFLVEIAETYGGHVDDDNEYVFCTIDDLGDKILEVIDSEDIVSWTPIGSREFVNKFNEIFFEK